MNAREMLQMDCDALYLGNLRTVEADLELPAKGGCGSDISWSSDRPHIIDGSGKVTRPLAGLGDRDVTLTARLRLGGHEIERAFTATVLEREPSWRAKRILPYEADVGLDRAAEFRMPACAIVEKDDGGHTAVYVKWGALPRMDAAGAYTVAGEPPLDRQPELVPCATIHVADHAGCGAAEHEERHAVEYAGRDVADRAERGQKAAMPAATAATLSPAAAAVPAAPPATAIPAAHIATVAPPATLSPAATVAPAAPRVPLTPIPSIAGSPPQRKSVRPFPLSSVSVDGGIFAENKERMLAYLAAVDDGSMLYNFRAAAGLDTRGAAPMTGWDAPECLLKGHTSGHYLSALALASCCCEGARKELYAGKIRAMVSGLLECQQAMAKSGRFHAGFLSAYDESQFDLLEQFVPYPRIWAPYYTLHKILAGLLDCHELAGAEGALAIAENIGHWAHARLLACGEDRRRKMWSMYIAGEYGGMNEALARLHRLSPKPEYLQAARWFDNECLFFPMEMQIDTLDGIHANQHIPQIVGCMELYERTGDARYRAVAEHFWRIAAGSHAYSIGGVGEGEMFRRAGSTAAFLTARTAETCASYNMLKLTSRLYPYTMEPCMMDYYERTLYNHIAASHDQSGPTGGSTYFMPLQPGARKRFSTTENTCCHGTGLENHLKYQECVYWRAEGALYVSLFIPSTLRWDDMGIRIAQRGDYAADGIATFSISGSARFALNLRLPGWMGLAGAGAEAGTGAGAGTGTGTGAGAGTVTIAASGAVTGAGAGARARLIVNGREERFAVINGYGSLTRDFRDGDIIEWHTPLTTRFEPAPDDGSIGSFFRGPLVLAAQSAETGFLRFGGAMPRPVPSEGPLAFRACGHAMLPAHMCGEEPFHIYVKR